MAIAANLTLIALSLLLGGKLILLYRARPRPHTLWYAVGLIFTALAACPELVFAFDRSVPTGLWWAYWVLASTLVGALGVGSWYLVWPRTGRIAEAVLAMLVLWLVIQTVRTAGPGPVSGVAHPFVAVPSAAIKPPFLLLSIGGSLVIFGGALWSFIRTRTFYNVWIALGTLIFAAGGTSSGLLQYSQVFYFTQTVGIVVLYLGVSQSLAIRTRTPSVT